MAAFWITIGLHTIPVCARKLSKKVQRLSLLPMILHSIPHKLIDHLQNLAHYCPQMVRH